jgi:hypothetical protein
MTEIITINGIDFTVDYNGDNISFSGGDIIGNATFTSSPDGGIHKATYDLGTHANDNSRDAVHKLISQLKRKVIGH